MAPAPPPDFPPFRQLSIPPDVDLPEPRTEFWPFDPSDAALFLESWELRREHDGEVAAQGDQDLASSSWDHGGPPSACAACADLAAHSLRAFAGRALSERKKRAWSRSEAMAWLQQHPVAMRTLVQEGKHRRRARTGRRSKPARSGLNATYLAPLERAAGAGELEIGVELARKLLGQIIFMAQLPAGSRVTHEGHLPWMSIAQRLGLPISDESHDLIRRGWRQIERACDADPKARAHLEEHVRKWSPDPTLWLPPAPPEGSSAEEDDLLERGMPLHAVDPERQRLDEAPHIVADMLDRAAEPGDPVPPLRRARAVAERVVADLLGGDCLDESLETTVEEVAQAALVIIRNGRSLHGAASIVTANGHFTIEAATEALEVEVRRWRVPLPYDRSAEGRWGRSAWFAARASDVLLLARSSAPAAAATEPEQPQQSGRRVALPRHLADCYEILGIPYGAGADAIREAFHTLAEVHRPDAGGDPHRWQQIEWAYEQLMDRLGWPAPGAPTPIRDGVCPVHFTVLPATGQCDLCEDVAGAS